MALYELNDERLVDLTGTTYLGERVLESRLQTALRDHLDVLFPGVAAGQAPLVVAEEYADFAGSRRRIDLLAVDRSGQLVVVELKRTEDGGHMELQALRYAAMVSTMTFDPGRILWAVMPIPWAHLLVSEETLLRVSRRVYEAPWYRPNMFDVDAKGIRIADKYNHTEISRDYLNKYLIRDFERVFREAGFAYETHPQPFGSASWTRPLLAIKWLRELLSGYVWFVLTKPHQE